MGWKAAPEVGWVAPGASVAAAKEEGDVPRRIAPGRQLGTVTFHSLTARSQG